MAIAIGDDSCKDRPIYVRVTGGEKSYYWYVIEEKPPPAESWSSSSSSSDIDEEDGNDIVFECKSESDRIRRLSVPDPGVRYNNSLAVLNSRLYLIGGEVGEQEINKDGTTDEVAEYIGYRLLDLDLGVGRWRLESGKLEGVKLEGEKLRKDQFGSAAVGHDGLIYSVGYEPYRFFPGGIHEKLPTPPPLERLCKKERTYQLRLLGLTKKKLFIYIIGAGENYSNLLLSYDLELGRWDDDYVNFLGYWSVGVVLYNDRYLFSLGTQNPIPPKGFVDKVVPGIYVFDIERRQWLPEPVEGLRTDGTVLPRGYKPKPIPGVYNINMRPGFSPYLFQIGKHNDHKLALLWEFDGTHPVETDKPQCNLVWSKFILNASTTAAADQIPHFSARLLSHGLCPLDKKTYQLINCAAGMEIEPEKQSKE